LYDPLSVNRNYLAFVSSFLLKESSPPSHLCMSPPFFNPPLESVWPRHLGADRMRVFARGVSPRWLSFSSFNTSRWRLFRQNLAPPLFQWSPLISFDVRGNPPPPPTSSKLLLRPKGSPPHGVLLRIAYGVIRP